jgi:SAM-dependent methyltransferase
MNEDRTATIGRAWRERQRRFGNTERAVLYKNLPGFANRRLHRQHAELIRRSLPSSTRTILDIGCGYGRIAAEVQRALPESRISGVELSAAFADAFRLRFHGCFTGSIEDYQPTDTFDAIIIITVLMYVQPDRIGNVLRKYWNALNHGGTLICVEQCSNFLIDIRKLLGSRRFESTGGDVTYFRPASLADALNALPGARVVEQTRFGLLPIVNWPVLHAGFVLHKAQEGQVRR